MLDDIELLVASEQVRYVTVKDHVLQYHEPWK
jgi:hypothetical protein